MNLFAHAVLGARNPLHQAAAIVADRIRGIPGSPEFQALAPQVQAGVLHHRALDTFTDTHPLLAEIRDRFPAPGRRIAGILLDLYGDYLLHSQWQRWRNDVRTLACTQARDALRLHGRELPSEAADWAAFIVRHDLLRACEDLAGVRDTAARLGRRMGHSELFQDALRTLGREEPVIFPLYMRFLDEALLNFNLERSER